MSFPTIVPFAEQRPSLNNGFIVGGKDHVMVPRAYVPHSTDGPLMADPFAAFFATTGVRKGVHLWNRGDGHLIQMCTLNRPSWGNGIDYKNPNNFRADGPHSHLAIIREWYAAKRNPNLDTISLEFAGQGLSRGANFSRPTDDQMYTQVRLAEWFKAEGVIELNASNIVLHGQLVRTACPDGRFDANYLLAAIGANREDDMAKEHIDRLERVERLLAGHGSLPVKVSESNLGAVRLIKGSGTKVGDDVVFSGLDALAYLDLMGNNFWLGLAATQSTASKALKVATGLATALVAAGVAGSQLL